MLSQDYGLALFVDVAVTQLGATALVNTDFSELLTHQPSLNHADRLASSVVLHVEEADRCQSKCDQLEDDPCA